MYQLNRNVTKKEKLARAASHHSNDLTPLNRSFVISIEQVIPDMLVSIDPMHGDKLSYTSAEFTNQKSVAGHKNYLNKFGIRCSVSPVSIVLINCRNHHVRRNYNMICVTRNSPPLLRCTTATAVC